MQIDAPHILVDADACPVKQEIYKVAGRHKLQTVLVANAYIRVPEGGLFRFQKVDDSFDAADDWIAQHCNAKSIVVTNDILLAERCLTSKASAVLSPTGKPFTDAAIGNKVATRAIMEDLRASVGTKANAMAAHVGGPSAFSAKDRSRFLEALHLACERAKR